MPVADQTHESVDHERIITDGATNWHTPLTAIDLKVVELQVFFLAQLLSRHVKQGLVATVSVEPLGVGRLGWLENASYDLTNVEVVREQVENELSDSGRFPLGKIPRHLVAILDQHIILSSRIKRIDGQQDVPRIVRSYLVKASNLLCQDH